MLIKKQKKELTLHFKLALILGGKFLSPENKHEMIQKSNNSEKNLLRFFKMDSKHQNQNEIILYP